MNNEDVNLDQLLALTTAWCLMVAATLRIPDLIAGGPHDVGDLATAVGCDRDALNAVLGYLVVKGVFTQEAPGRYATNQVAEQLTDPGRFLDLEGIGGRGGHTPGAPLRHGRHRPPAAPKTVAPPLVGAARAPPYDAAGRRRALRT